MTTTKDRLTAKQALDEVSALLSTTEGDVRNQADLIFTCVTDSGEKLKLKGHPLYRAIMKQGEK